MSGLILLLLIATTWNFPELPTLVLSSVCHVTNVRSEQQSKKLQTATSINIKLSLIGNTCAQVYQKWIKKSTNLMAWD